MWGEGKDAHLLQECDLRGHHAGVARGGACMCVRACVCVYVCVCVCEVVYALLLCVHARTQARSTTRAPRLHRAPVATWNALASVESWKLDTRRKPRVSAWMSSGWYGWKVRAVMPSGASLSTLYTCGGNGNGNGVRVCACVCVCVLQAICKHVPWLEATRDRCICTTAHALPEQVRRL